MPSTVVVRATNPVAAGVVPPGRAAWQAKPASSRLATAQARANLMRISRLLGIISLPGQLHEWNTTVFGRVLRASVSELSQFVGDCNQVVAIDPLDDSVPVIIDSARIHGAEDPASDGRDGVTVSADVRGQEDCCFRSEEHCRESQRQRHDREGLIRKAARGRLYRSKCSQAPELVMHAANRCCERRGGVARPDRKSTRLNSSHEWISYAVFCLKKK